MGLLTAILRPQAFSRSTDPWDDQWYSKDGWLRPGDLGAGSMNMALHLSAVMACTRAIAQPTAMVPLITYEYLSDGSKRRAVAHPVYRLLHDSPNPELTAMEFREMLLAHAFLRGTGYARIVPDRSSGQPVGSLWPIHSDHVQVERLPNGTTRYRVQEPGKPEETILFDEMFKVRGLSVDGVSGVSFLEYARRTMGTSTVQEEYRRRFYTSGGGPRGAFTNDSPLGPEERKRFNEEFKKAVAGVGESWKTVALPWGVKWQQIGVTNKDAQWLEGVEFDLGEYERWSGVPAHVIGDLVHATFSNIEEMGIEYVVYCLNPWGTRVEQSASRDLFLAPQRFRPEHLWDALLKGKTIERFQAYQSAWWMTGNEIRSRENLNALPGLDEVMIPVNMLRQSDATQQAARATSTARLFAMDAAKRTIIRELRSVEKAAKEHADDGAAWEKFLEEFYAEHERQLAIALHLPASAAHAIAERHRLALLGRGAAAAENWEIEEVAALTECALGGGETTTAMVEA